MFDQGFHISASFDRIGIDYVPIPHVSSYIAASLHIAFIPDPAVPGFRNDPAACFHRTAILNPAVPGGSIHFPAGRYRTCIRDISFSVYSTGNIPTGVYASGIINGTAIGSRSNISGFRSHIPRIKNIAVVCLDGNITYGLNIPQVLHRAVSCHNAGDAPFRLCCAFVADFSVFRYISRNIFTGPGIACIGNGTASAYFRCYIAAGTGRTYIRYVAVTVNFSRNISACFCIGCDIPCIRNISASKNSSSNTLPCLDVPCVCYVPAFFHFRSYIPTGFHIATIINKGILRADGNIACIRRNFPPHGNTRML